MMYASEERWKIMEDSRSDTFVFFGGIQSFAEVINILNNRISIILAEKRQNSFYSSGESNYKPLPPTLIAVIPYGWGNEKQQLINLLTETLTDFYRDFTIQISDVRSYMGFDFVRVTLVPIES